MNKLTRLGRSIPSGHVRIGVVFDSANVEIWKIDLIQELLAEPAIKVAALFTIPKTSAPPPSYARLVANLNAGPERLVEFPSNFPVPKKLGLNDESRLSPEAQNEIAECDLDVLLWLANIPDANYGGLARFGAWWFSLGDPRKQAWRPAFFAESARGDVVLDLWLLTSQQNSRMDVVLERYSTSAQPAWNIVLNPVQPLKEARSMLVRRLLDLLEFGPAHFRQRISHSERVKSISLPPVYPNIGHIGRYFAQKFLRTLKVRFQGRGRRMHWFIAVRCDVQSFAETSDRFIPFGLQEIPTSDSQEADPFVLNWRDRTFLFYEEIPAATGRGCISCREIGPGSELSKPVRVIEQPYHMSYPFLLAVDQNIYMLPETSENRTLELYRATNFPFEWTLDRVLLRDVALVDTTPFKFNDIWYFFTTISETGETLLFYSDRFDGEWHYHPMNPICSDVRRSRSAGAVFCRNGRLIRPAQDCSVRYGYAVALNEITVLSPAEYSEKLVETILPNWTDGLLGTHTLNATASVEVLDGLRMVKRF